MVALHAGVPVQHHLAGVVRAVNLKASIVTITPERESKPVDYIVETGRTRCRRDGEPARLADISASQLVEIYYRRESGSWVATEISWKSAPAVQP